MNTIASFAGKDIWLKIFSQEYFFDFDSFDQPLKRQVSILKLLKMNIKLKEDDHAYETF